MYEKKIVIRVRFFLFFSQIMSGNVALVFMTALKVFSLEGVECCAFLVHVLSRSI